MKKKKYKLNKSVAIPLAILLLIIIITVIFIIIALINNNNNNDNNVSQEEPTTYYYCYRANDYETTCGEAACKYSSYYKFKIINYEQDTDELTKHVEGTFIATYKFDEENFQKVNKEDIVPEGAEFKVDAQNLSYTVTRNLIIQPGLDIEFNLQNELEYLNSQGFYDCEPKNE